MKKLTTLAIVATLLVAGSAFAARSGVDAGSRMPPSSLAWAARRLARRPRTMMIRATSALLRLRRCFCRISRSRPRPARR